MVIYNNNKKNIIIRITLWSIILLPFLLIIGWLLCSNYFKQVLNSDYMRLEMYKATLYSTIEQYNYLPYMVAIDPLVKETALNPEAKNLGELRHRLTELNIKARTAALFVLDTNGKAIASSNWNEKGSYEGHDYSYRPYFIQAMKGQLGKFYGMGSTTLRPGFFLAQAIEHQGQKLGVIVVKINLKDLESVWAEGPESVMVSDQNGVIFLSSNPDWRMKVLHPLSSNIKEQLNAIRQYNLDALAPPQYTACFTNQRFSFLNVSEKKDCYFPHYYSQNIFIPEFNWTMTFVGSLENVYWFVVVILSIIITSYVILIFIISYIYKHFAFQRMLKETNELLELKVNDRTRELKEINQQLIQEMNERLQAEEILQHTRGKLAESSKLAALGQMATETAHEHNQPLTAIHALTENAQKMLQIGMYPQVQQNLKYIISLVERMTQLTSELKAFATRHRVPKGHDDTVKAIHNAVALLNYNLEKHQVELQIFAPDTPLVVGCDSLGLEQIFSNLIINALDAMEESPVKRLVIDLQRQQDQVIITIKDSGRGFSADVLERIFEPFFTTKRRGMGLGLAIVKEIIHNSEGVIKAENHPEGGAVFTLSWSEWRNTI